MYEFTLAFASLRFSICWLTTEYIMSLLFTIFGAELVTFGTASSHLPHILFIYRALFSVLLNLAA